MQGKKETRTYVWTGAALCVSFFLIRIVAYGGGLAHLWTLQRYWMGPGIPFLRRRELETCLSGRAMPKTRCRTLPTQAVARNSRKADLSRTNCYRRSSS